MHNIQIFPFAVNATFKKGFKKIGDFQQKNLDFVVYRCHNTNKCEDRKLVNHARNYREQPFGERRSTPQD